jgi:hypothetical protein
MVTSQFLEQQYVVFIGIDLDLQRLTAEWNLSTGQPMPI